MKSLKCLFGLHNYNANKKDKVIKCSRCEKVNDIATIACLSFEIYIYDKVKNNELDIDTANEFINEQWNEWR